MEEVDNILRILRETKEAILRSDSYKLRQLSDQTIHSATIYQDSDNIVVAVLVYALSKIIERDNYRELDGWKEFYKGLIKNLDNAIIAVEKEDIEKFRQSEKKIRQSLEDMDDRLKMHIEDVFRKSRINKASKIYEHGLSLEKTANLLGVSLWELSSYVGQSRDEFLENFDVKKRIKLAEEIFE
jgi:hypothetical protein